MSLSICTHATVTQTQHTSIQCTLLCAMSITRRVDQHAAFAYNLLANSYIIIMEKASCSNAPCIVSLIPIKQNKLKNMGKLKKQHYQTRFAQIELVEPVNEASTFFLGGFTWCETCQRTSHSVTYRLEGRNQTEQFYILKIIFFGFQKTVQ